MLRYHYKIWFPDNLADMLLSFFQNIENIALTTHAKEQLVEDRRGIIPVPTKEQLLDPDNILVEVYEQVDGKGNPKGIIQKIILRLPNLNPKYDYTYVVARENTIVSAWANSKTDDHRVINSLEEYYCPEHLREIKFSTLKEKAERYVPIDYD
jgi:hypothetical protein